MAPNYLVSPKHRGKCKKKSITQEEEEQDQNLRASTSSSGVHHHFFYSRTSSHDSSFPSVTPEANLGSNGSNGSQTIELFQKYEELNTAIDRLSSSKLTAVSGAMSKNNLDESKKESEESIKIRTELMKVRRDSSLMIQIQKELLDKIKKQEKNTIRNFFTLNREQKMEKLKSKLCEKLSESVLVDEELKKLESRSDSLHELRRTSMNTTTSSSQKQEVIKEEQLDEKLHRLEREKEDILNNLFQSCRLPDGFQLHSRISIYSSEVKACDSILKQTEKCLQSYRQALQLLRIGLSTIVSPNYTASVKEFIRDPYPLAIEAGHLIEAASHCIQPESHRRYRTFAPELTNVKLPKFPQAIVDYAKRIRTNIDSHSTLAMESTRKLRTAENIVIVMQRLVIEKLELIEKWQQQIQKDRNQALEAHQKCESKLKTQIAVLAHTVSA